MTIIDGFQLFCCVSMYLCIYHARVVPYFGGRTRISGDSHSFHTGVPVSMVTQYSKIVSGSRLFLNVKGTLHALK